MPPKRSRVWSIKPNPDRDPNLKEIPPSTKPRTLADLSAAEVADLEKRYGMPVRPRKVPKRRPPDLDSVAAPVSSYLLDREMDVEDPI